MLLGAGENGVVGAAGVVGVVVVGGRPVGTGVAVVAGIGSDTTVDVVRLGFDDDLGTDDGGVVEEVT